MAMTSAKLGVAATTAALLFVASQAAAKPARCFTTDDGYYPCDFQPTDGSGSFEISAPGYPTFSLLVESPGFASAYGNFDGTRSVPLPGTYVRQSDEPACWASDATDARICAW